MKTPKTPLEQLQEELKSGHYTDNDLIICLKKRETLPPPPIYHQIPEEGFLRLAQIVNHGKSSTPPLLPISRSSWLAGVKSGKYPPPVKIGVRMSAWRAQDIRKLIREIGE